MIRLPLSVAVVVEVEEPDPVVTAPWLVATEFEVLWCLVHAAGRVLTREQILARVWGPGHHGTLRTVDNFLAQLRSKLERDPADPRHLLTVRGVGYRFEA